jgi:hypothetical protein
VPSQKKENALNKKLAVRTGVVHNSPTKLGDKLSAKTSLGDPPEEDHKEEAKAHRIGAQF